MLSLEREIRTRRLAAVLAQGDLCHPCRKPKQKNKRREEIYNRKRRDHNAGLGERDLAGQTSERQKQTGQESLWLDSQDVKRYQEELTVPTTAEDLLCFKDSEGGEVEREKLSCGYEDDKLALIQQGEKGSTLRWVKCTVILIFTWLSCVVTPLALVSA